MSNGVSTIAIAYFPQFSLLHTPLRHPCMQAALQYTTFLSCDKTHSAPSVSIKSLTKKVQSPFDAWRRCYRVATDGGISWRAVGKFSVRSVTWHPAVRQLHSQCKTFLFQGELCGVRQGRRNWFQATSLTLNIPSLTRQRFLPSWGLRRTPCFFVISQL
jgi:hypothetical protein